MTHAALVWLIVYLVVMLLIVIICNKRVKLSGMHLEVVYAINSVKL